MVTRSCHGNASCTGSYTLAGSYSEVFKLNNLEILVVIKSKIIKPNRALYGPIRLKKFPSINEKKMLNYF